MRGMILAAGKSTRLGQLGLHTPKPMLPLGGRPVLEWTLERLRAGGITEVVINLHHAAEVIPNYFGDGSGRGLKITYLREEEILGTAGGVKNAQALLQAEPFIVVYGDNVLNWDPMPMLERHNLRRPIATVAVAEVPDPSRSGVVRFDADGMIAGFIEKPGVRPDLGRWVSAAVYVLEPAIFDHIVAGQASDFGYDVFPALLARGLPLQAFALPEPPLAIDTPEQYAAARSAFARAQRSDASTTARPHHERPS